MGGGLGCHGGQLPKAWDYLTNTGIVTDSCFPYAAGDGTAPACPSRCQDAEPFYRFKARNSYAIKGVTNMQKEIMTNGPIQVAFMVYKSFMSYKSGVYKKHIWEILPEGGRAVKIVGRGVEAGQDYGGWLTAGGLPGALKATSRWHVAIMLAAWRAWALHMQVCHRWNPTTSSSSRHPF